MGREGTSGRPVGREPGAAALVRVARRFCLVFVSGARGGDLALPNLPVTARHQPNAEQLAVDGPARLYSLVNTAGIAIQLVG